MKYLHICFDLSPGGVTEVIKSISSLNSEFSSVHDILCMDKSYFSLKASKIIELNYRKTNTLIFISNFIKILSSYNFFLLHAIHPFIAIPLLVFRKKTLVFQHGMTVNHGIKLKRYFFKLWYSIIPVLLNSKVICSSEFSKNKNIKNNIFIPDKYYRVIPFGVAFEHSKTINKESTGQINIGLAGRLVKQKRFDRVLLSLKKYNKDKKLNIHIAGDGPEYEKLNKIKTSIKNKKINIFFLGTVSNMADFYKKLDLFILPSVSESFGLVILEALSFNIPTIVFNDVGGVMDIIKHNKTGFILETNEDLNSLLDRIAENIIQLNKMKQNCLREEYSKFSVKNTRSQIELLASEA